MTFSLYIYKVIYYGLWEVCRLSLRSHSDPNAGVRNMGSENYLSNSFDNILIF